jgi:DNA topoisomerase-3
MRLIIAEKPSVARGIADVLGHGQKADGCIICGDTTVTWCAEHLLTQANSEDYVNGGFVRRDDLPVVPDQWQLNPKDDRAKKQIGVIKALLKQANEVVNAGDADREGQLLVDEVLLYLGWKGKTLRLWLSSLDEESVRRALASFKPNETLRSLYDSALARQRADWLLGLNGSIALSRNLKAMGLEGGWSVGRVQTPTLALIVDRHARIKSHVKQEHYKVRAILDDATGIWQASEDLLTDGLLLDKQQAKQVVRAVDGRDGKVIGFSRRKGTRAAPLPYSLAALQMDANSHYGLSAKETLEAAQALYEAKLTTYPRTDCRYLPEEMHSEARKHHLLKNNEDNQKFGIDPHRKHAAWNTKEVTAHHAIIPTNKEINESELGTQKTNALKLYKLIKQSYIRLFMSDEEFEQQQALFQFSEKDGNDLVFKAMAKNVLYPGWTALDLKPGQETSDEEQQDEAENTQFALPDYTEGQQVHCNSAVIQTLQTKPARPYNDKTLIAAMTGIHRLVTDARLKARLKETSGLGTGSHARGDHRNALYQRLRGAQRQGHQPYRARNQPHRDGAQDLPGAGRSRRDSGARGRLGRHRHEKT